MRAISGACRGNTRLFRQRSRDRDKRDGRRGPPGRLLQIQVVQDLLDDVAIEHGLLQRGSEQQRIETDAVDGARHAVAGFGDHGHRIRSKQLRSAIAGHLQAMLDVLRGLVRGQRLQPADNRDALQQLRQFRAGEFGGQLQLPGEDDVQQLAAGRFEIGEQPHRLEHRFIQVLGFVNDDQHGLAARLVDHEALEIGAHPHPVVLGGGDLQFLDDGAQELLRGALGIEQEGRVR